eukprot:EG_transcript_16245
MAARGPAPSPWRRARSFVAGMASGFALVLAGHPFDTVKVRLQTEGVGGRFGGPLDCLAQTVRREGAAALYKGVTPPLLMTGLINSALFGMQSAFVHALKADPEQPPTVGQTMQAAVLGGLCISFAVQPMEAVKARLQVQYNAGAAAARYSGPLDCVRQVVASAGVRGGLYRGWTLTALCRMSNYAYFGPYEYFRKQFGMTSGSSANRSLAQSLTASVLCGSASGVCYWSCCYPLDVIKNRIMTAPDTSPPLYRNGWHCATLIYRQHGPRGFLVGLAPCMLRSIPANAAAFTAYELAMHLLPS